ncbi:type I methionyl aminopeptidase [Kiloniella laminariae]|uniref:Methionine aminopeptidase n=1 Tax=Kiloniella laminariae TaxID=454162 RepID=A0ABT4LP08_9PROT|nr:type I methionyl aminopeptidase [Kiloniella laminariae]MCZ4282864.1 type I methionyl aminopeptidase [Kiloniella laminariae]
MIKIKTPAEIEKMRVSGKLTAQVLEAVGSLIRPGISTMEINDFCESYIRDELNAIPGSKGQYDYPYAINCSLNHVICHGIPSTKVFLGEGDILNIDVTVQKDGYYGDSSKMFAVGKIAPHASRLIEVTRDCLYQAIKSVRPGKTLGDVGHAIQTLAEQNRYSVVREFCGHGIGRAMHEPPEVAHFGTPATGTPLVEGMTFTIEPMINQGRSDIRQHTDGWTVTTRDRRLSAQCEHTVLVTENGYEILTLRQEEQNLIQYRG